MAQSKNIDKDGNVYVVENNTYYVELTNNGLKKRIGRIDDETATLFVRRKKAIHLHKKSNSYGFSDYVIENSTRIKWVYLSDEDGHYKIPISVIRKEGIYLHFKRIGFELQKFLSLDIIRKYKVDF